MLALSDSLTKRYHQSLYWETHSMIKYMHLLQQRSSC